MENRYDPVESLAVLKDVFVAAYDSGNREYIKSMVLEDAVPGKDKDADQLIGILPPHFNTRINIFGITDEEDGLAAIKNEQTNAFSDLPQGVEPVAVIKYSYYMKAVDGKEWLTFSRFPVVKKGSKLYIVSLSHGKNLASCP